MPELEHPPAQLSCEPPEPNFAKKLILVAGVVLVLLLAWYLIDILLLIFASVLVAILFRALADVIARPLSLSPRWSLALAVLLIAALVGVVTTLFGATIRQSVNTLLEELPAAWQAVRTRLDQTSWLLNALERSGQDILSSNVVSRISGALGVVLGAVTNLVLVVFSALYIAAQPGLYRNGFLKLVPPKDRPRIAATMDRCGDALRNWLLGQVIAMMIVGTLTYAGLSLLSVPSAFALALFAGLAEFVPILGPIVAAIPALIIALSQDVQLALSVLVMFLLIQQFEGNLLMPIIQRKLVSLPPAITLFAILAFAILFGAMGALFATPLAVVTLVLVNDLYIKEIERSPPRKDESGESGPARPRDDEPETIEPGLPQDNEPMGDSR